jgi:hypothetical protein
LFIFPRTDLYKHDSINTMFVVNPLIDRKVESVV